MEWVAVSFPSHHTRYNVKTLYAVAGVQRIQVCFLELSRMFSSIFDTGLFESADVEGGLYSAQR